MSAHSKVGGLLERVASAVGARRSTDEEVRRHELHGGSEAELSERLRTVVPRLERAAARLEAALDD